MPFRIHLSDLYKTGDATQQILNAEDPTFQTQNCVKPGSQPLPKYEHEPDGVVADMKLPSIRSLPNAKPQQWKTYFIASGDFIKIGKSTNVDARFDSLRTSSAHRLILLAVTDIPEKTLHQRFAHLRVRGEWFDGTDELMTFIKTCEGITL
jgi:hypothetical protein